ncbi:MAG TPA: hypothetical protein VEX15_19195 [Nocardioidaceae bacterium]|nr:hypothetical protein [Nocardioidaceae bacterium]
MEASDLIAFFQFLTTVLLALLAYRVTRSLGLLQGEREVRNAWLSFDLGVLASPPLLETADLMLRADGQFDRLKPEMHAYWRWICYAVRNPLENFYEALAQRHRHRWQLPICCDPAYLALISALDQLVHDETFMEIARGFSADHEFFVVCKNVRYRRQCDSPDEDSAAGQRRRWRKKHECLNLYGSLPARSTTTTAS